MIYAAIVAGWAAVLVPRWVRRNEEVERAREVDEDRGVRVLQRRSRPIHATHDSVVLPSERTVLHGGAAGLTVGAARRPAPPAAPVSSQRDVDFGAAARRRRRTLALLLVVVIGVAVAATRSIVPSWVSVVPATMFVGFLVLARRAAVTEAQRRRAIARRQAAQRARVEADVLEYDDGPRVAVLDEADLVAPPVDPDAWEPAPVPRPTYLSKAMAPRVTRAIDLSQPGSWTSGRLDPVGSVTRPAAASPADDEPSATTERDDDYDQRRAVGD